MLLDSRSLSGFTGGRYLVWDIRGNVNIVVTRNAGPNAVVSGLFFGPGAAPTPTPTPAVVFVTTDTTTQGNWNGTYGAGRLQHHQRYRELPGIRASQSAEQPATGKVPRLTCARCAKPHADRIAATWYSATSFTINLNLTDGQSHRIALYCVDWDNAGRSQTVEIRDGTVIRC